jgi:hypothetical protein
MQEGRHFLPGARAPHLLGEVRSLMSLPEAEQLGRRKFWGGWAIVAVGSFLLLLCMLETLYHATSNVAIKNLIVDAYEAIPFFDLLWPYLPLPSASPLLSAENLKFAGILSILGSGTLMRNSGSDLLQRIATARKNAEGTGGRVAKLVEIGRRGSEGMVWLIRRRGQGRRVSGRGWASHRPGAW